MKVLPTLSVIVFSLALSSPVYAQTNHAKEFPPPLPADKAWKLIWQDEFDGPKLDETKWNRLGDSKRRDGFWIKEDAYLSGKGTLLLRTKKDGDRYTCGAVNTQGKFEHAFGYYVARCKMPEQPGHWPAFWMMCSGVGTVGDGGRDGTEIDIMELPWRDGKVTFNLHWDGYGADHQSWGTTQIYFGSTPDGWHQFGLLWEPGKFTWYIDGKKVMEYSNERISKIPSYLKLNVQTGGWATKDIDESKLPDFFKVDYVRAWQLKSRK